MTTLAPPDPNSTCVRPTLDFTTTPPTVRWVLCVMNEQTEHSAPFEVVTRAVGAAVVALS